MTELIFATIHGSHLYGLAHEGSDFDRFEVSTSTRPRARHTPNRELNIDTCSMGLDVFMRRIFEGSHQSVEALFSPYKTWYPAGDKYRPMLEDFRVNGPDVFAKYERTIKRFCYGDFKRRRHAVRLWTNLNGLRAEGRFNPAMSPMDIVSANRLATDYENRELWDILTG